MLPKTAATDVGIHFVIGLEPSPALTDHDKRLLSALRPAGIVVFRPNFTFDTDYDDWLRRFEQLLVDARRYIDRERILILYSQFVFAVRSSCEDGLGRARNVLVALTRAARDRAARSRFATGGLG